MHYRLKMEHHADLSTWRTTRRDEDSSDIRFLSSPAWLDTSAGGLQLRPPLCVSVFGESMWTHVCVCVCMVKIKDKCIPLRVSVSETVSVCVCFTRLLEEILMKNDNFQVFSCEGSFFEMKSPLRYLLRVRTWEQKSITSDSPFRTSVFGIFCPSETTLLYPSLWITILKDTIKRRQHKSWVFRKVVISCQ